MIVFEDGTKVGVEINQIQDKLKTLYYVSTQKHDTMISGIESDRVAKIPEFELGSGKKAGNTLLFPAHFSVYYKEVIS